MKNLLTSAMALLVSALVASAGATTKFVYSNTTLTSLTVGGELRTYAIAAPPGSSSTQLYYQVAGQPWVPVANAPALSPYAVTGAVGVTPASAWGSPRVLVVTAPQGTTPARLYDVNYDTAGVTTWHQLSVDNDANGPDLSQNPAVDAAYDSTGTGALWIAVRASDNHVWSCTLSTRTSYCGWTDESCYPSANHCASPGHPATTQSPVAVNTQGLQTGDRIEIYWMTATAVWRESWYSDAFDALPATSTGGSIDLTGLKVITTGGATRVLATTYDGNAGGGDNVQIARNTGGRGTATWTWSNLTGSGSYYNKVNWAYRSIAFAADATNGDAVWFSTIDTKRLVRCALTSAGSATQSCTAFADGSKPVDQYASTDSLAAIWANSTDAQVVGSIGPTARYLYQSASGTWSNRLSPRDAQTPLPTRQPGSSIAEFSADEYFGTIVATAFDTITNYEEIWRSTDDGNTWVRSTAPWPSASNTDPSGLGDANVGIDAAGNEFVSIHYRIGAAESAKAVHLVRWDSGTGQWLPLNGYEVRGTSNAVADRPWMIADRYQSNVLYMTWAGNDGFGYITRSNGTGDCLSDASWCPPTKLDMGLPGLGCRVSLALPDDSPACQLVQDSNKTIWLVVGGDTGCSSPPAGQNVLGIRAVTFPPSCGTPTFSAPACLRYVGAATAAQLNGVHLAGGTINPARQPGVARRWNGVIAAARDAAGVAVQIQGYARADGTGGTGDMCDDSVSQCRADQYFAFVPSVGFMCDTGGCSSVTSQDYLLRINADPITNQVDHIVGRLVALDGQNFVSTWMDFRGDSTNDQAYAFRTARILRSGAGNGTRTESNAWPASLALGYGAQGETPGCVPTSSWYGDIDTPVNARLHAHFFVPETTDTLSETCPLPSMPETIVWSPANPQE